MLRKLFTLIKIGFKSRLLVSFIVIFSASYFMMSILPVMLRLILLTVFLIGTCFWLVIYIPMFMESSVFRRRKVLWQPMPSEYIDLAGKMGVSVERFGVEEGLNNAYTIGKKVVLGKKLMEKTEAKHLLAIVVHELGHIKGRHQIKTLVMLFLLFISIIPLSSLPPLMFWITVMVYFNITLIPVCWKMAFDADRLAAEYVGIEDVKEALLAISGKNIDEPCETHPSIAERIKNLNN